MIVNKTEKWFSQRPRGQDVLILLEQDFSKLQGVRFNVGISSTWLKSTILLENLHGMAHFLENMPPFVILSKKVWKTCFKIWNFLTFKKALFSSVNDFQLFPSIYVRKWENGFKYNFFIVISFKTTK